jgi:hypothetical protein
MYKNECHFPKALIQSKMTLGQFAIFSWHQGDEATVV